MQRAKVFFYVCLGVSAIAVGLNLFAREVTGQGTNEISNVAFGTAPGANVVCTSSGDIWWHTNEADGSNPERHLLGHVNSSSPIVAVGNTTDDTLVAYAQNGDFYSSVNLGGSWTYRGNLFGGATQATGTTWGRVKAERR